MIPHKSQRYETCGDWRFLPGGLHVSISSTGNDFSDMLVAIHEIVEAYLCDANGVSEKEVDMFDMGHPELNEPGEDQRAPYHLQHVTAEIVERIVAQAAGVNWQEHCDRIDKLFEEKK